MGSFSKKKSSKSNDKAIAAALAPKPYYHPFGDFANNTYTPKETETQQMAREGSDSLLADMMNYDIQPYSLEDALSGDYFTQILDTVNRNTDRARDRDYKQLQNNLNARNQIGSSYDALMNSNFASDYADQYANNATNAIGTSLGALGDIYTNNANVASIISGINQQQYNRFNQPAAMAQNYQQSVAPLQTALASHYSNQAISNANRVSPLWGLANTALGGLSSIGAAAAGRTINY